MVPSVRFPTVEHCGRSKTSRRGKLDVSQLKRIPLFADVPDESLRQIATFATSEEWPEGKQIVKEGGYSNQFFAVEEGTAKVERAGQQIAELGPGDVFGEQGLLEKQERSATVTATSPIKLIKIDHWELSRMRRSMPEVVERLKRTVEERAG
jgi:CRP/FNR family cyclic AMP-dependent transcriptional regulator